LPDFGIKKAYRPRLQEWPGYKTLVDEKSERGILPEQTESRSIDRGQSLLDSIWPVERPQSREKERALPLPSNHDKKREKRIGPTYFNKPRKEPERTLSEPGDEYGHPTKWDYHMPKRRHETLAGIEEDFEDEEPIEDQLEVFAQRGPFPPKHQKNLGGQGKLVLKRWYKRHKGPKLRSEKLEYRTRGKRLPREKLKRKYRRMYPHRYRRIGIDPRTPAQKTKEWREENQRAKERSPDRARQEERREQQRTAGLELLAEVMELLGFDVAAQGWPLDWNTHVKKIQPPEQLDQNYGEGQSRDEGTPRKDPKKQKGQPLRAPDLDRHHQKGLKWEIRPPAPGGLDYPLVTTMNPSDGSGKVIPMEWYTEQANKTQAIPDGRQDRYLHNNNFDVKVAMTVGEILSRCDRKIKERSKEYAPKLARTDTKNWIWHWKVGDHTVRVQAFKRGRAENFPKLNLRISCSCPFWRWWGPEHWGTRDDYQRGPLQGTATYPKIRDPAHWRPVCKHAYAVLEKSRQFFVRPEKSPLRKFGMRFSPDSIDAIEVEIVNDQSAARVAQRYLEREICRRVLARYLAREES